MRHPDQAADRFHSPARRSGRIVSVLLGILVLTFVFGIMVINSYFVAEVRLQQQNASDAAALAAAEVLADEAMLYGDPALFNPAYQSSTVTQTLTYQAVQAGIDFGNKNFVGGNAFNVQPDDLFLEIVDVPRRQIVGTLPVVSQASSTCPALTLAQKRSINAVHVVGKSIEARKNTLRLPFQGGFSDKMITRSIAVLDGYVYGFHTDPNGAINIPLAPLALGAANWSAQVERNVDPSFATPINGPLPYGHFTVVLGASSQDSARKTRAGNAPILRIGTTTVSQAVGQFNPANLGITPVQYGNYRTTSGQAALALDLTTQQLSLPAFQAIAAADLAQLEINLLALQGKRLVWPLYSGYDELGQPGNVIISGFVAARVVEVKRLTYHGAFDKNGHGGNDGRVAGADAQNPGDAQSRPFGMEDRGDGRSAKRGDDENEDDAAAEIAALQITLRPTLLATSTSIVFVKDWPTGPQYQFRFPNAYVKRIRLLK